VAAGAQWLMATIGRQDYAVPVGSLREVVAAVSLTPLSVAPRGVRGLLALRDQVMPVIDLRVVLGLPSVSEEVEAFATLLTERERDHCRWLAELEASVVEDRPFTLGRDPTQCAFGRWYASYRADDAWVALALKRLDAPHRRVHALAGQVEALKDRGHRAEALALIASSREHGLHVMIDLFASLKVQVRDSRRETFVVLRSGDAVVACSVDAVRCIEWLEPPEPLPPQVGERAGPVTGTARRGSAAEPALVLDPAPLFELAARRDELL
jgi:purine-binding chemotaxis protein CheW